MSEKLQKVLARAGLGSRRELETMIQAGRVSIDGQKAKLGDRLENVDARIRIDGHVVSVKESTDVICRVLAYHKPEGELCTRHDPEGRRTVFDRLPKIKDSRWVSVGRLDANTAGLLLFTTDGELANRLMHPSRKVEREYMCRIFGDINDKMVKNLVTGVKLEDGEARFEDVMYAGGEGMNHTFYVVINEGRNREVRRLWDSQGVTVSRLKRVRYGDIFLEKALPRGGWMELELKEVNYLRDMVELPHEKESLLDVDKESRKRAKSKSQKIRRAVKRHDERTTEDRNTAGGRRGRNNKKPVGGSLPTAKKPTSIESAKPAGKGKPKGKPSANGAKPIRTKFSPNGKAPKSAPRQR
ncbi:MULTISPECIES: 23S rRNA pseudouridine(2605) synthase RluB [Aliivibrio]|jgi:23S rRNA pseudouridine2605 synthase|uniref:Pseudouridine synthase n=3 Tax=Aliivibrio TaxID=511678 RepID=A0A1B9P171_ALILO|nr:MULTISPECIES: 23S rRNA pseudouridine(2605) synthase RluB [Aliivibrio]AZL84487.1 23S rRNA pseudouridine(2605) synthase RluB [Aliivibrio salmonicida]MBB1314084.1 23S rRNA pseudouridine(2605) synthase RluB [Aliivibrio sp. SR45-2]OCH22112.1 23S rRNA pseudouridylate synthase B [Aliivibrio logei]OEF19560.1 23S rRNA pseudouridylate synthase B [Aliivibrio logei 5S-186]CAQ78844.1 ribosomal large subunit pseudouridine synthase B (rRNA pseudouridylate synthase B) [Aliivibrio salmonicida LFI1238]